MFFCLIFIIFEHLIPFQLSFSLLAILPPFPISRDCALSCLLTYVYYPNLHAKRGINHNQSNIRAHILSLSV
ncbi:hypothetical protein F5X96DRAFT_631930 [Biscogniauxia mediterranea]|nr:hypothetical protein F5X96DRAFT_631930 [Biscogniauxia mediterranea]